MVKKERFAQDLKVLREFIKGNGITYESLSKEMNYSIPHISKVFNGERPATEKFMQFLLKGIQQVLQRDLKDFYKLIRGMPWTNFNSE